MVRLAPTTKDLTTKGFAQLFMREVFTHYGFPSKIVSDRGTQWNSAFFRAICEEAGVELALSTAYHPQTNGLVERSNEVVEAALRQYISADMHDWHELLPLVELALNSCYYEAIQSTPYRMNRVTLPATPFESLVERSQTASTDMSRSLGLPLSWVSARTFKHTRTSSALGVVCMHPSVA
jgi:transposase InsO family protein